ncbi:YbbR-like domain-containing protein [Carnobacterium divergens]|uniref:YbbR-like family protein n=1 Tax=Carnobacterium divergens TaxID=2748 RepID=A0A7Z8D209_CARDV|nr:CdaR family protein [Carnobacterium divergens]TFI76441.1 hypothetical protein CKN58_00070 [Carnobacterium divergens]TFI79986.1 hypothetical protein CKN85_00070 [Carnobacterium divergens]TFI86264.1 hypothetical protein CKN56_00070 [Carnobacterium divergens]TFI98998.1 hypothetical protein CKN64_00070 [Carnobacterium divergens]TFJ15063.1 hypothetical protein CKN60_00065 [Carnobacterium divergens]
MIDKIYNNPWFLRIIALVFALLLFSYVNFENNGRISTNNPIDGLSVNSSQVISNVPITVDVDQDKYFVSGLPETVSVKIEGSKNIIQQTITAQNFKVVAKNLNKLGVGTHKINLSPEGFSDELAVTLTPSDATVIIENKKIKTFNVDVEFNKALLARGYEAGTPTLDYNTVQISGAESTIDKISRVYASVSPEIGVTKDINQKVPVQVLDESGNKLDVNINPKEVQVTIPVKSASKDVPIMLNQTGTPVAGKSYKLGIKGENTKVNVTGDKNFLESLSSFPVSVDVTGITETTTKEIALSLPEGITSVSPITIKVVITVSNTISTNSGGEAISPPTSESIISESTPSNSSSSSSSSSSKESSSSSSESSESKEDSSN